MRNPGKIAPGRPTSLFRDFWRSPGTPRTRPQTAPPHSSQLMGCPRASACPRRTLGAAWWGARTGANFRKILDFSVKLSETPDTRVRHPKEPTAAAPRGADASAKIVGGADSRRANLDQVRQDSSEKGGQKAQKSRLHVFQFGTPITDRRGLKSDHNLPQFTSRGF